MSSVFLLLVSFVFILVTFSILIGDHIYEAQGHTLSRSKKYFNKASYAGYVLIVIIYAKRAMPELQLILDPATMLVGGLILLYYVCVIIAGYSEPKVDTPPEELRVD